jgi:signal transduction histidine kinase
VVSSLLSNAIDRKVIVMGDVMEFKSLNEDGAGAPPTPAAVDRVPSIPAWTLLDNCREIAEMIARRAPAHETLERVARVIETATAPAACSILLVRNKRLYHLAAPSLPAGYCAAIDGIEIGPLVGSCGSAAYARKPVVVRDIAEDGRWDDFRDLALAAGLRACWSLPILDESGEALGTFAIYHPQPREPGDADWHLLRALAALTRLAITQDRLQTSLHWQRQALLASDQRLHLQNIEIDETRDRLKRQIAEIERQTEALAMARSDALMAERTQSEFLANVSHELRTPLGAVIGFSELMLREMHNGPEAGVNEKHRAYLRDINESGRHLLEMVSDILDLSKIDAGRMSLIESKFDARLLLSKTLRLARPRVRAAGISLTVDFGEDLPFLWADELKLRRVLLNLISNAIKFTPQGGRIVLVANRTKDGGVAFSVQDTGIGMTADEISLALLPFRQIEAAYSRRHEGLGLGLPLAKSLIDLHGGTLAIQSQPQVGTNVTATLPPERTAARDAIVTKKGHPA